MPEDYMPGHLESDDDNATKIDMTTDPVSLRMTGYTMHGNMPFTVPFMSQITGNLWQGGCQDGLVLPKFIKHLVSLYPWEMYTRKHELDSLMVVRMHDSIEQDTDQVLEIASWVNSCRNSGPVLVHCQAGLNRSSLIVGASLVLSGEKTGPEAVDFIRETRSPACLCNRTFASWLSNLVITEDSPDESP